MKALRALSLLVVLASCSTPEPVPIHRHGLENAYWLTDKVLSGAQPEGDAAFGELAALGVKTVISVDGAIPDAEAARRHGLRTVHLPIGYDGVSKEQGQQLAKAILELPGPVYVHCHHGLHRSPAAAVVACVVAGRMSNDEAVAALQILGTGAQYRGLWQSAREARPEDPSLLRSLRGTFPEAAPVPPLAKAMVAMQKSLDRLELSARWNWEPPAEVPDVDPGHEALKIRELCAEIRRTRDFKSRPPDFNGWMQSAEAAAARLEDLFRLKVTESADRALGSLKRTCADCHAAYRN